MSVVTGDYYVVQDYNHGVTEIVIAISERVVGNSRVVRCATINRAGQLELQNINAFYIKAGGFASRSGAHQWIVDTAKDD